MNLRHNIVNSEGEKIQEEYKRRYRALREQVQVTKDQIPSMLKDIFDIFVDSHMRKSFLNQRGLIDDHQKRTIRQAVLKSCAYCGPDSDFESDKITSKFLDLSRIIDEDYECEGLLICIKWFIGILEDR